jgi:hypothetical protein
MEIPRFPPCQVAQVLEGSIHHNTRVPLIQILGPGHDRTPSSVLPKAACPAAGPPGWPALSVVEGASPCRQLPSIGAQSQLEVREGNEVKLWPSTERCHAGTGKLWRMRPVQYVGHPPGPYPKGYPPSPYTILGYKFPLKPCRLFLTRLKSTRVEKILPQNIPHREIWPLNINENIRFFTPKQPQLIAPMLFR